MKTLLIVAHAPSHNTRRMAERVLLGARHADIEGIDSVWLPPLQTEPRDVLNCHGIILGTPENLGYMSGALKDFFDRIYYPCLDHTRGLPCALYVRAGHDGTGTRRAVESICTGLRWNWVQPPLICRGQWREDFLVGCEELGMAMAAGMETGLF